MDAGFMINIIKKNIFFSNEIITEELTYFNLDKLFQDFSHDDYDVTKDRKKYKWIHSFVDNLFFQPKKFNKLENRIAYFFKSKVISIKNQNSPFISLDIHKAANKDIQKALIVSEQKIEFKPS